MVHDRNVKATGPGCELVKHVHQGLTRQRYYDGISEEESARIMVSNIQALDAQGIEPLTIAIVLQVPRKLVGEVLRG